MKLFSNILGRLLYAIIGAIIVLVVLGVLLSLNQRRISPVLQSKQVAEILADGIKHDSSILLSPESLASFIRNQSALNQKFFMEGNLTLAVIPTTNREGSLFVLTPGEGISAVIDGDGKATLNQISQRIK